MLDFELLKKSNIKADKIDLNKSFASFNSNTCNLIIELFLKKEESVNCPICDSKNIFIRGSRCNQIKSTTLDSKNVIFNVHRRVYKCECGYSFTQNNPISYENRRISVQKEIMILNALRDKTRTYSSVAKEFDVSVSYVINLFDTKVDLKRLNLPPVLCIDEVYAKRLVKNSYCCVLFSPQWKKIIDVVDSRRKFDLIDYFAHIPIEEKNNVEFVSMDLWDTYRDVIKKCLPKAKISADPFHVVKNLVICFQKIRIKVMNRYKYLKQEGSNYYWLYKKFWKFLITDLSKLSNKPIKVSKSGMLMSKYGIVENMLSLDSTLAKAYELKEEYRNFVATASIDSASVELDILISKFKESRIKEYYPFIHIMEDWHDEIINSFHKINNHKITNGPMERVNRDIKTIFGISFGSTNFYRVRNRIMFSINEDSPILAWRKSNSNKKVGKARGNYKIKK